MSVAGKAQANEQRYTKLKEKYTALVQSHADLLRKVGVARPIRLAQLSKASARLTESLKLHFICPNTTSE